MSIFDAIKNSVLQGFDTNITAMDILLGLGVSLLAGLFILVVYKNARRGTAPAGDFCVTLLLITAISAMIVLTITSNLALSLGMVGALSIVRFRTAVKDPMDLCFLFWSIAVGICCGAHMSEIAIILSVFMTFLVLVLDKLPMGKAPMILVVNMEDAKTELVLTEKIKEYCKYFKIKSRNIREHNTNLVIELRVKEEFQLVQAVKEIAGIKNVSLVSHDGEATF